MHYERLIEKAKNRSLLKTTYKEVHHIIPKCLGGSDDKTNLINLLPEEHVVAHLLLAKIHPNNNKLTFAAFAMTCGFNKCNRLTNKEYRWVREKHAFHQSKIKKGIVPPKERTEKRLKTMYANDSFKKMGKKISNSLRRIEPNGKTVAQNSMTKIVEKRKCDVDENGKNSYNRAGYKRIKEARKIIDENGMDKISVASMKMAKTRSIKNEDGESSYTLGAKKGTHTRATTIEPNGKTITENAGKKLSDTLRSGVRSDGVSHIDHMRMRASGANNGMAVRCNIVNANHEIMFVCDGNIKSVCLEHNIPIKIRYTSKDNFLYKDLKGVWKQKCIDNGNYFYYGWYIDRI